MQKKQPISPFFSKISIHQTQAHKYLLDHVGGNFYFFKAKTLNGLIINTNSKDSIDFTDICFVCDDQQYLRRYYRFLSSNKQPEIVQRLTILTKHYNSHHSIGCFYPTMYLSGTQKILRYWNQKACKANRLKNEQQNNQHSTENTQNDDQFLINLNDPNFSQVFEDSADFYDQNDIYTIFQSNSVPIQITKSINFQPDKTLETNYTLLLYPFDEDQIISRYLKQQTLEEQQASIKQSSNQLPLIVEEKKGRPLSSFNAQMASRRNNLKGRADAILGRLRSSFQ